MNSLSIFIVEDEIITAKSIAKNIRKFGYNLAGIATSGSEAISQILKTRPDLVLIDIFLDSSNIDGIAVANKIQSELEIPILYLTAHSDRETLERAKITTPFGYILKPYNTKSLQISIELALHKHQQDQQVVKREKILTTILDANQDSILATDEENQLIYMNSAAKNLTESKYITTGNLPTAKIVQLIDEQTQKISEPIQEILKQGEVIYLEESAILLKKVAKAATPNQDEETIGAVLMFTRNKDEISSSNSQSSLVSDQLLQDLRTYLIDLTLHELRTPLTVILSTAQSLKSYRHKWTIEKQDQNLHRIQQAIGQIRSLLDNIAVWNELEKGEIIINPDWVDLLTLSQDIIDDLKLVDGESHQLTLSSQGDNRMLWLDRNILRCIIVNLLINGLKYSPPGTVVALSLQFRANLVIIQVRDHGIGIPSQEQKRIFESFYRASNASKIRGTGLGLAIVEAYTKLCDGDISLFSEAKLGTVFTISLPLKNYLVLHN